jgi:hypothetical protein
VADQLLSALENQNHCFEQAAGRVETRAQFPVGRTIVVKGLDPRRPLSSPDRILG